MSVAVQHAPTLNGLNGASSDSKKAKSKNQLRRQKAKQKKAAAQVGCCSKSYPLKTTHGRRDVKATPGITVKKEDGHEEYENVEYVSEQLDLKGAALEAFSDVFARFQFDTEDRPVRSPLSLFPLAIQLFLQVKSEDPSKGEVIYSDDEMAGETDSEAEAERKPLSKKKQRKLNRLTVAELKQLVAKPEVVEWTDVSAADPRLLLHLKCYRNTIPIPAHWSAKRDYLQGKRGIEKPPFQLPSYIADTGIATQRDAIKEKEANMSLKAKTRERVQPKMGKIDIDYQKLHDAFFKFQTKPPLTSFGEMYYEGKEFETSLKEKRPGDLSPELVEALSIPPLAPPPWLISMQRFGPPPSYPTLRIPGLNAPIPEGCVVMITFWNILSLIYWLQRSVGLPSRWMGETTT
jgi:splicing factor 3B subunit 2